MEIIENIKLFFQQINTKQEQLIGRILLNKSMNISITESCTGGLISSRLTDLAGSSAFIKENYVTYSNEAKVKLLNVNEKTLSEYGAVSEECAKEMVEGLFQRTNCDIALATTGIAGPGSITKDKNAGLLYVAIKSKYTTKIKKFELNSNHNRKTMKFLFSQKALGFLIEFLTK
jgi:PncC family amidohydrolase